MRLLTSAALVFALFLGRLHASAAPQPLTQSFTPEEFAKAGLNKLTPEELSFLEETLARHQQQAVEAARHAPVKPVLTSKDPESATFGAEQVSKTKVVKTDQELHAHIEGTLESFSGRAVFVLDNGQIWQQRIPDTVYLGKKLVNPEVVLTRGLIGYKMVIVPADRVVFVKRIQ